MTANTLDKLDCPFNWIPDDLFLRDVTKVRTSLKYGMKWNKEHRILGLLLGSFLWSKEPEACLDRGLKEVEEALDKACDPEYEKDSHRRYGYKLIALGNLAFIQELLGDKQGKMETLEKIIPLQAMITEVAESKEDATEDCGHRDVNVMKIQGCIAGVKAFTMNEFNETQESLLLYREAENLDPLEFKWPLGRGVAAGQMQRLHKKRSDNEFILQQLDKEQEESIERAVELTEGKNYIPLMRLADVYFWRGRGNVRDPATQDKSLMRKAEKLFLKAYSIEPESGALLKRIGKAFTEIHPRYEKFALECLLGANKLGPNNSMTLHRLGQFYEHASDDLRDLEKAEAFYIEAVHSGPSRNLLAEIDMGRVRKKMDKTFDGESYLKSLFVLYPNEDCQDILRSRLEMLESIQNKRRMRI